MSSFVWGYFLTVIRTKELVYECQWMIHQIRVINFLARNRNRVLADEIRGKNLVLRLELYLDIAHE
jgi:hypothetical protein